MTDADVDGSHIRTLILTFLYRQMPELINAGHVYIAVPPLYKVKLGIQEFYFEKDAQLEDLLARERVPAVERDRPRRRAGEADRGEVDAVRQGPALSTRATTPACAPTSALPATELMILHRLVEHEIDGPKDVAKALDAIGENGYALSLLDGARRPVQDPRRRDRDVRRAQHHRAGRAARVADLRAACATQYAKLVDQIGQPPFTVTVGKEHEVAESFDDLRARVLDAAKQGIQVSRFKGLGEMNADQLWETTMDPAKRLLDRVEVEDAAAADQVFSMLMGDAVEPRRIFIEENATNVKFLDV